MKILLVAPVSQKRILGEDFYFKLPVLSMPTLAAYTPPDIEIELVDERIKPLDYAVDADLVAITAMTALAPRAYEIADTFRSKGKTVVMGGMHPSALPQEALQHCNSVAVGEGEVIWPQIIEDFKNGRLERIYKAETLFDVSTTRPPRWDIVDKSAYSPVDFIESTRGCPFNCSFCAVTNFFGGKYRTKPLDLIENLVSQVKPVDKRFALKNLIFFIDDNIVGSRRHCKELLTMLKSYNIQWVGQASITVAKDDEILKMMAQTRCLGLLIGMESISSESLADCGKRVNKPAEYLNAVDKLHSYGIGVKATFIVGFDSDDQSVFPNLARFIQKSNLDSVYLSIMTPYPGTRFYKEMEEQDRILHKDWEKYDTAHVVFQPAQMTPDELQQGFIWLYKKMLSYRSISMRLLRARTQPQFFIPDNLAFRSCMKKMVTALKQETAA